LPVLVALVPALVLARTRPRKRRFRLGWWLGVVFQLVIMRWIPFTVTEMSAVPLPVAWLMWFAYAAWHAIPYGLFFALSEPVRRAVATRAPWASAIAVAALFVVLESGWPTVFPWSLGQAFWEFPPVACIAGLVGVPGLVFFVALVNAALADAWVARRDAGFARTHGAPAAVAAGGLALTLLAAGTAWHLIARAAPVTRTLQVAIVQANYTLDQKKHATLPQRVQLLDKLEGLLAQIPRGRFDLIVGSEGTFPLYWKVDAEGQDPRTGGLNARSTRRLLKTLADGPHTTAVFGGLRENDAKQAWNSAVLVTPDGHIANVYDKRTLVPFGEYIPLSSLFPSLKNVRGIGHLEAGVAPCAFDIVGVPTICGICYETMFAGDVRADAGDARLQLNLTIDTWFGHSTAPWMHLMVQSSRAIELGTPLVRAALTGVSTVVYPDGTLGPSLGLDETGVLPVAVPITELTPLYRVLGPVLPYTLAVLVGLILIDALRRRRELFPRPAVGGTA
jgi:apolipoprotein N-acyltransferase